MTSFIVAYEGDASARFDRDHFVARHIPLVRKSWRPHGLVNGSAFFPAGDGAGLVALALCEFRGEAAMRGALASAESPAVMDDVPRYTDIKPAQSMGAPVGDAASRSGPARMIVACYGDAATRFDRSYYVDKHLPLTRAASAPLGLETAAVFFPADDNAGVVAVGVYGFRDGAALHAALAAEAAKPVMDDVPQFTAADVRRELAVPIESADERG